MGASASKLRNARALLLQLLQLIARSQLTSLSGAAQKNYFSVLDKIVQKGKRCPTCLRTGGGGAASIPQGG